MKQTGILSVRENNNGQSTIKALPNIYLYFKVDDKVVVYTQTDDQGRFDFDLPLGEYKVFASVAKNGQAEYLFARGEKFVLRESSRETEFEEWLNGSFDGDINQGLTSRMEDIMLRTEEAARSVDELKIYVDDEVGGLKEKVDADLEKGKEYVDEELKNKRDIDDYDFYRVNTSQFYNLSEDGKWGLRTSMWEHIPPSINAVFDGSEYQLKFPDRRAGTIALDEDLKEKRDLTDNKFTGMVQVQSDNDSGTGLFLLDNKGTVRGQMMFSNTGLQFAQQVDGKGYNYGLPKQSGELLNDKSIIPVDKGGTGATTAEKARENLGTMSVGEGGLNREIGIYEGGFEDETPAATGFYSWGQDKSVYYGSGIKVSKTIKVAFGLTRALIRVFNYDKRWTAFSYDVLHTKNTAIDTNGFIKAASPIIKLFDDRIEHNDQFKEEPVFKKLSAGVYEISNTMGLAKEGWYIETPKNRNGFPLLMVDWEQKEDNTVIIRTFERKLDIETLDFINGDPVDIGERWIDLRFHEEEKEEVEE